MHCYYLSQVGWECESCMASNQNIERAACEYCNFVRSEHDTTVPAPAPPQTPPQTPPPPPPKETPTITNINKGTATITVLSEQGMCFLLHVITANMELKVDNNHLTR